ncbi:hypothetical protein IAT38_006815 [Cryptococcus sp. DSM 104549]
MPPKSSNLVHVTCHFYRSAIVLSVPSDMTFTTFKSTILPALQPLASALPIHLPTSASQLQLWEANPPPPGAPQNEAEEGIRNIELDSGVGGRTLAGLGWVRWKSVFVSFQDEDGTFAEPVYTVPDADDEEPEGSE